jgi:formate dehydrogenase
MATVEVDLLDLPYDFDSLAQAGSMSGSGAIIVMDDSTDIVEALANIAEFYAHESCGQCTPCRVGTEKAVKLMSAPAWDEALLTELAQAMGDASICGLGQAACNPLKTVMKHFREDLR